MLVGLSLPSIRIEVIYRGPYTFSSNLLVAGCDIGVQVYFCLSICLSTISIKMCFSTAVTATSDKPCILIVLDILFEHAL